MAALHIVMFPWLAFGHLIPFYQLAKSLAQKGNQISFISTPRNLQRLPKIPPNLAPLLNFVELPLPQVEHLPDNAEATTDLPRDQVPFLKKAYDGLEAPLARLLKSCSPDWIIYDFAPHWLPPIAAKLDIPCAFFSISNAANICFFGPPSCMLGVTEDTRTNLEEFTVPPKWISFSSNLAFRMFEIVQVTNYSREKNESGVSDILRFATAVQCCDIVVVRSCMEFEGEWLSLLGDEVYRKPVLPIGLLPPQLENVEDEKDEKWEEIKEWLDKQEKNTVIYVAFGSEATLSENEAAELALGLELSELSFFWVIRSPPGSTEVLSLPLSTGYKNRVKGRGMVWKGWVPQLKILGHPSIGGSLMHSGWSSVVETLGFGHPLVLLPMVNDQPLLARLLEWKKVGLDIPRDDKDGAFTRDIVAKCLRKVMVDEEGEEYRSNARAMRGVFRDKALHDGYVDDFLEHLKKHGRGRI